MRSKSRTSSSKSCESRTGNLAATDASAPNFPAAPTSRRARATSRDPRA